MNVLSIKLDNRIVENCGERQHLVDNALDNLAETRNVRRPRRDAKSRLWYVREKYEAFDDDERPT